MNDITPNTKRLRQEEQEASLEMDWIKNDGRSSRIAHDIKHSTCILEPSPLNKTIINGKEQPTPYAIPMKLRKELLNKLLVAYGSDFTSEQLEKISSREKQIAQNSHKKTTYIQKMSHYLLELRRKDQQELLRETTRTEIVILDEPEYLKQIKQYLISKELLEELDFPYYHLIDGDPPLAKIDCDRCHVVFDPEEYYSLALQANNSEKFKCVCHDGRLLWPSSSIKKKREREYTCCGGVEGAQPCATYTTHVYSNRTSASYSGQYLLSSDANNHRSHEIHENTKCKIIALDCEMVYTIHGLELARVTVTDWNEQLLLDLLIKPDHSIVDYNTKYSGISQSLYDQNSLFLQIDTTISTIPNTSYVTFSHARESFLRLLSHDKIITTIVGHSLENDLRALKVIHPYIIDTSQLFPHPKGPHMRSGLKYLAATHLQEFIQQGGNTVNDLIGHSSKEDAMASLRLFKFKLYQDSKQNQ